MRQLGFLFAVILLVACCGCPDYSHLRPVPDYENMTDGATEQHSRK